MKEVYFFSFFCLFIANLTACSSLLYVPTKHLYVDLKALDPKPEEWAFNFLEETGQNQQLFGWYFSSTKKPKAVIIQFHGNGQNRTAHFLSLYWLVREGYDLFTFDYPGYGETLGKPTPKNTVEAGKAAMRAVAMRRANVPLIIYGQSLGGAIALRSIIDLKGEINPKLVVAESTFLSYRSAARSAMSKHWVTWLFQPIAWLVISDEYAPGIRVKDISPIPLLVIHAKKDPIVSFTLGEKVFENAQEPKEFWPLESGRHIDAFNNVDAALSAKTRKRFLQKLTETLN